ncbi:hypothetical protein BVY04_01060, partial [bacterium M21]
MTVNKKACSRQLFRILVVLIFPLFGGCGRVKDVSENSAMQVFGNDLQITNGDMSPSAEDNTHMGAHSIGESTDQTFTIRNIGGSVLILHGDPIVDVLGSERNDFQVVTAPASEIAPGASTIFSIRFLPLAAGTRLGTVSISSNDINPYLFAIDGFGIVSPEIDIRGNSVSITNGDTIPSSADHTSFGVLAVNSGSITRTFTIHNLGGDGLTLDDDPVVAVMGVNPLDFTVTRQPTSEIPPGENSTFEVTFTAKALDERSASLQISNTDRDENPFSFGIAGTGRDAKLMSSDFHQHASYTGGSSTFSQVMEQNNDFGLFWWANSGHGGGRILDGELHHWDDPVYYPSNPILGDYAESKGHQVMWRWQSLRDFVFPDILTARALYSSKRIVSGLEWNVPGHEHCSIGIVASSGQAISAFEYMFDLYDDDTSRNGESTPFGILEKRNGKTYEWVSGAKNITKPTADEAHQAGVSACTWLQAQYEAGSVDNAYTVFAHPERRGAWDPGKASSVVDTGYNVEHFREYNDLAPDICFGFDAAPGHQASGIRGGYDAASYEGTYGG